MKKYIIGAAALVFAMTLNAQTEVLKIELTDGSVQTIDISTIEKITFEVSEPSMAEVYAGDYTGTNSLNVGGMFNYSAQVSCHITANADGTINFTWDQYSIPGTQMGDLTLGTCTIANIAYDEAQGVFYRDYSNDGIKQHFTAVGSMNMDNDYVLGSTSTITIKKTADGIEVTNPFKLGAMPLPLTSTFVSH